MAEQPPLWPTDMETEVRAFMAKLCDWLVDGPPCWDLEKSAGALEDLQECLQKTGLRLVDANWLIPDEQRRRAPSPAPSIPVRFLIAIDDDSLVIVGSLPWVPRARDIVSFDLESIGRDPFDVQITDPAEYTSRDGHVLLLACVSEDDASGFSVQEAQEHFGSGRVPGWALE